MARRHGCRKAGCRATLLLLALALALVGALALGQAAAAGSEQRSDTNTDYLSETWHAGLGTGVGAHDAIVAADLDGDGVDELAAGNSQGYLHVLDWNASQGAFVERFQSIDLGGAVKGLKVMQFDDDDPLEIIVGYTWADSGKVRLLDGRELRSEANWTAGLSWSHIQSTERDTYGLAAGDLDGDGALELAVGGSQGFLWVVDAATPESDADRDVTRSEAEWYIDLSEAFGSPVENVWGIAMGQLDEDASLEVAVGTKQGWVGVFDGATGDLQWKWDIADDTHAEDGQTYALLAADLDGNGIDELVVGGARRLTLFPDGDRDAPLHRNGQQIQGLEAADLFGDADLELVVADKGGGLTILGLDDGSLVTYQSWQTGYRMAAGSGVTVSLARGAGSAPWIIHGGDAGVLAAWEISDATTHTLVWESSPDAGDASDFYSLPGGWTYGTAVGDIDDDATLEVLVGTGAGRVFAFDGANFTVDWASPVLADDDGAPRLPIALAVADLDGDGEPEIAVGTGNPGEQRESQGGAGAEGYLYIFDDTGSGFELVFESDNLDRVLGLEVLEIDGSAYPEIGLVTSYTMVFVGMDPPPPEPHGRLRVWGWNGSAYVQEGSSGDLREEVMGIVGGDPDGDGDQELVIGTQNGSVRVYGYHNGSYALEGDPLDTTRRDAYGLAVVDIDDDGETEIVVGTGESDDEKPLLLVYDGKSHEVEWQLTVDAGSVWGIAGGDVDGDNETELVYGTSGGQLFIRSVIHDEFEAKTSALSGMVGHYGGLHLADLTGNGSLDLVAGSEAYLWVLLAEGVQPDRPDLFLLSEELSFWPADPDEDDDIMVNLTVRNQGGREAAQWRVEVYDGPPEGGARVASYTSGEGEAITPGGHLNLTLAWYHDLTAPGEREVHVTVDHLRVAGEPPENRRRNNRANATLTIRAVPNAAPVAEADLSATTVWINDLLTLDAGRSHDAETTGGLADSSDGVADLEYNFYPAASGGWSGWLRDWNFSFSFESDGVVVVQVRVRDERGVASVPVVKQVTIRPNGPPVAELTANLSQVFAGDYVTFNVSGSRDPDGRATLAYRFAFGDGVASDWVAEGGRTWLYAGAEFDEQGVRTAGEVVRDTRGEPVNYTLRDGLLLGDSERGRGYSYALEPGQFNKYYRARVEVRETDSGISGAPPLPGAPSEGLDILVLRAPNRPPVAVARAALTGETNYTGGTLIVVVGDFVTLSATDSHDPDGEIVSYYWTIDGRSQPDGALRTLNRTFTEPGTYRAVVEITDDRGAIATAEVNITVTALPVTPPPAGPARLPLLPVAIGVVALGVVGAVAAGLWYRRGGAG